MFWKTFFLTFAFFAQAQANESQDYWTPLKQVLAKNDMSLNDDGSVIFQEPFAEVVVPAKKKSFWRQQKPNAAMVRARAMFSVRFSGKVGTCRYLAKTLEKYKIPKLGQAFAEALPWGILTSDEVPAWASSKYVAVVDANDQVRSMRRPAKAPEFFQRLGCHVRSREIPAPLSERYQKLRHVSDGTVLITEPRFKFFDKERRISSESGGKFGLDVVCKHYGFDTFVEGTLTTTQSRLFGSKIVLLDRDRRVRDLQYDDEVPAITAIGCRMADAVGEVRNASVQTSGQPSVLVGGQAKVRQSGKAP